jgi:hypothetical protein
VNELDQWMTTVCDALGIEVPGSGPILDLARDVAHGVLRPAAPVTAYLVGLAVGRGADPADAFATVAALVEAHVEAHTESGAEQPR